MTFTYRSHFSHVLACMDILSASISSSCAAIESDRLKQAADVDIFEDMETRILAILANVRYAQNAVQPINQLPVEILSKIFSLITASNTIPSPDTPNFRYAPPFYRWVTTTTVCRRWREVALASPSLWAMIDTCNIAAAEKFIERSGQGPIDAYLRDSYQYLFTPREQDADVEDFSFNTFAQNLVEYMPRIRALHVGIWNCHSSSKITTLLESPAPSLKYLSLCMDSPTPFTDTLFAGYTPRLTHVIISGIRNFPPHRFTNLTQFCFCEQIDTAEVLSRIANLLRNNESLEELFLSKSQGPHPGDIVSEARFPKVHLPCLRKLSFYDYTDTAVAQFLSLLSLPSTVYAQFRGIKCHPSRSSMENMFPYNFEGGVNIHNISRLRVEQLDQLSAIVTCIGDAGSFLVEVGVDQESEPGFVRQSLDFLAKVMGGVKCGLKELWLDNISFGVSFELLDVASTPRLTKIVIQPREESAEHILSHFSMTLYAQETPNIDVLDIRLEYDVEKELPLLLEFVQARAQLGVPIRHIILTTGYPVVEIDEHLVALKRYVEVVDYRIQGEELYEMDLPEICQVGTHSYWPAWNERFVGPSSYVSSDSSPKRPFPDFVGLFANMLYRLLT